MSRPGVLARRALPVAALLAWVTAAPAAAEARPRQDAAAATPTLVRQTPWVPLGGDLALRLRIGQPAEGRELSFVVHEALLSRTGFEQTVRGESLGGVLSRVTVPLDDLELDDAGDVVVRFALPGSDTRDATPLRIRRTGVYPMEVSLAERDAAAAPVPFITWVVVTPEERIETPLSVSWIWSLTADPLPTVDGAREPGVLAEFRAGGRLDRLARLLAAAQDVPLTLQVGPETLDAWTAAAVDEPGLAAGRDALRDAVASPSNQVLPEPYVPLRIPDLENAGLGALLQPQLLAGAEVLQRLAGVRVDPRSVFTDPVDQPTLERLRALFVDRVTLREQALVPVERHLTAARPFTLEVGSLRVRSAATNEGLAALLEGGAPPGLRAQRFLAGLSLVALEAPALPRGLVFAAPERWDPEPALVELVLDGLRDNPLLQAVTLDTYFQSVPDDTVDGSDAPLVRTLAPSVPGGFPVTAEEYRSATEALASFRTVVGADDPRIVRGERALLLVVNSAWSRPRARAELDVIDAAAAAFLSAITTTEKTVTLTARRAEIPLSFRNDTGQPIRIRVHLASSKLLFPEGPEKVVELPEGNTTERFAVEARASGTFTMIVSLTSEDGRLPIGSPTRVTVRSAVFSGVGALLTIGALLFLAGWWANHLWRTRRRRVRERAA